MAKKRKKNGWPTTRPKKLKERKEKLGKLPNGAEENKGYFF